MISFETSMSEFSLSPKVLFKKQAILKYILTFGRSLLSRVWRSWYFCPRILWSTTQWTL